MVSETACRILWRIPWLQLVTEEFNITTSTVTGAAWASGGNLATARNRLGGAGTQTAGLAFGGSVAPGGGDLQLQIYQKNTMDHLGQKEII